jgi:hypothetical protein
MEIQFTTCLGSIGKRRVKFDFIPTAFLRESKSKDSFEMQSMEMRNDVVEKNRINAEMQPEKRKKLFEFAGTGNETDFISARGCTAAI